jgi:hypothetical protein
VRGGSGRGEVARRAPAMGGAPSGVWVMIAIAWGNVLSILLPGLVAVLALRHLDPTVAALLAKPNKLGFGGGQPSFSWPVSLAAF